MFILVLLLTIWLTVALILFACQIVWFHFMESDEDHVDDMILTIRDIIKKYLSEKFAKPVVVYVGCICFFIFYSLFGFYFDVIKSPANRVRQAFERRKDNLTL